MVNQFHKIEQSDRPRLSGAIREHFELVNREQSIEVGESDVEMMLRSAPKPFDISLKVRKLLQAVARRSHMPGAIVEIITNDDFPLAYACHPDEFTYLKYYAKSLDWITVESGRIQKLTPKGWEEVQHRPRIESAKAFVAMSFAEVMRDTYIEAIEPAVRDDCGYECRRVDALEYNGAVVDEIKAEIRESRFVVADVTNHRNGVYYEAGFADGLGIPVIWTCDESDAENTHFDTQHLNQIRWTDHAELRKRLGARIRGTIGLGPFAARM